MYTPPIPRVVDTGTAATGGLAGTAYATGYTILALIVLLTAALTIGTAVWRATRPDREDWR